MVPMEKKKKKKKKTSYKHNDAKISYRKYPYCN